MTAQDNRTAWRLQEYARLLRERIAKGMTPEQAREGLLDAVKKSEEIPLKRAAKIKLGKW